MDDKLIDRLCCPSCRAQVEFQGDALSCAECECSYPCIGGRPLLVPFLEDKARFEALLEAASSLPPRPSSDTSPEGLDGDIEGFFFRTLFRQFDRRDPQWAFLGRKITEMVARVGEGLSVLDIGAGECKYATLLGHADYVSTDLVFSSDRHDFSLIDVVADASAIPFRDAEFDVALNLVVLEHVPDPWLAVDEMARVLKPGGIAFAMIPLVRPEHLAPFDFHRFTRYGIQRMFENSGFRVDSIEGSNGTFWTAVHYARMISKTEPLKRYGRRSIRGMFLNRLWHLLLWPLVFYARRSDKSYGDEFPMYFWVQATREPSGD
ncbi:MAG: methyltransferase domain-containing protein [Planctomycetes bacterium]|nr:methyltransferase domain-containing protein [Planctomycetota bacterium]